MYQSLRRDRLVMAACRITRSEEVRPGGGGGASLRPEIVLEPSLEWA